MHSCSLKYKEKEEEEEEEEVVWMVWVADKTGATYQH